MMFSFWPTHLPKKIDTPSDYEGRDGCANHSKEGNGANVLEEITLNTKKHMAQVVMSLVV